MEQYALCTVNKNLCRHCIWGSSECKIKKMHVFVKPNEHVQVQALLVTAVTTQNVYVQGHSIKSDK